MNYNEYKKVVLERLSGYFDVKENYELNSTNFDIFTLYNLRNEKYIASKKFTVYAFENDEYVLLKYFSDFNENKLDNYIDKLKECVKELVIPHEEHMSTTMTGVIIVDNLNDNSLIRKIERFKYQKGFLFGLKGWADIRLILVDLNNKKVITCKKGRNAIKFYQP